MSNNTPASVTGSSVAELLEHPAQTRASAARIAHMSIPMIDSLIRAGDLPAHKIGRKVYILTDDLLALLRGEHAEAVAS